MVRKRFRADLEFAARCYLARDAGATEGVEGVMALVAAEHQFTSNELLCRWVKAHEKKKR